MTDTAHDRIPEIALDWHRAGTGAALATVVETWGSAPRQAGSQLAVSGQGQIMGSVSGGCVEGAVVTEALEAMQDGRTRMRMRGRPDTGSIRRTSAGGRYMRPKRRNRGATSRMRMPPPLASVRIVSSTAVLRR